MAEETEDQLTALLERGWSVSGYSTTIMAAGAMTHSILLQKGSELITTTIVLTGEKEVGRTFAVLSPRPAVKKGWLG